MTGTNFSSWFNASQGTFIIDFDVASVNATTRRHGWNISDSGNQRLSFRAIDGSGFANPVAAIGTGATAVGIGGTTLTPNVPAKIAVAYGSNMALVQNGGTPVTNASAASVAGSSIFIGYGGGVGGQICGHVKSLYFFNIRLLNAQAQAFTK